MNNQLVFLGILFLFLLFACCSPSIPTPPQPCSDCKTNPWRKCRGQDAQKEGRSCSIGKGACLQKGVWVCVKEKERFVLVCNAKKVVSSTEICNGKDDDCDGQIDEQLKRDCFDALPVKRNVGVCLSGFSECVAGKWSMCKGQLLPTSEICNGKDDDCDGQTDEQLQRSCYQGPASTKEVGVCRSGMQLCSAGNWGACKGSLFPKQGEVCLPVLKHTITKSLLNCEAKAQSQACEPQTGKCQLLGSMKATETRKTDDTLLVRCRGSHTKTCGAYTSEGIARRELVALPKKKGFRLTIGGFAGACACNNWCQSGCSGQGCCLTCNITERHCSASSNYLGYHQLMWEKPLPVVHDVIVEATIRNEAAFSFFLSKKTGDERVSLRSGQTCSIPLGKEPVTLLLIGQASLSCGGSKEYELVLSMYPASVTKKTSVKKCFD